MGHSALVILVMAPARGFHRHSSARTPRRDHTPPRQGQPWRGYPCAMGLSEPATECLGSAQTNEGVKPWPKNKVIITCAVTGSIHTPSMSPHLPVTAAGDRRRRDRRGRGRRRHRASARAQSAGRPARPDAGGLRAVPQGDQAALERGGEHHHRRRADHDGRRSASSPAATFKPEVASLNMGTMNFGLYPMIPRYKGKFKHDWEEPYLEGSKKGMFKNTFADIEYILTTCAENNTRFEIECYDIGHLYTLRHFLDRGLVKPPLFVQSVFGILGGIGAHPEDVMHDEAHRRPAVRRQLSLVGAGRRRQPDAGRRPGRGDGRQRPRRHGGFALDRAGQARRVQRPAGHQRAQDPRRAWGWRSPAPTRRARSSRSRAATR